MTSSGSLGHGAGIERPFLQNVTFALGNSDMTERRDPRNDGKGRAKKELGALGTLDSRRK